MAMETIDALTVSEGAPVTVRAPSEPVQRMQTRYATAVSVQKARQLSDVERRIMDEARIAGDAFYYGWGKGKDRIEGASQELAFSLARCWGNCAVELEDVQDTDSAWVFTCTFVDLETGFTLSRQFRQSKHWTIYGKHDRERKDDIRFQIGQSKAARNVILKALPQWLIDKAMTAAKEGVGEKLDVYIKQNGIAAAIELVVEARKKHGIGEQAIAAKFNVAAIGALEREHLIVLRGDIKALHKGESTAAELFGEPPREPSVTAESLMQPADVSESPPVVAPPSPEDLEAMLKQCTLKRECNAIAEKYPGDAGVAAACAARWAALKANRGQRSNPPEDAGPEPDPGEAASQSLRNAYLARIAKAIADGQIAAIFKEVKDRLDAGDLYPNHAAEVQQKAELKLAELKARSAG